MAGNGGGGGWIATGDAGDAVRNLYKKKISGGDERIRTADGGFADPCLATWLRRPKTKLQNNWSGGPDGAEDEARTRDLLLGKEAFYH